MLGPEPVLGAGAVVGRWLGRVLWLTGCRLAGVVVLGAVGPVVAGGAVVGGVGSPWSGSTCLRGSTAGGVGVGVAGAGLPCCGRGLCDAGEELGEGVGVVCQVSSRGASCVLVEVVGLALGGLASVSGVGVLCALSALALASGVSEGSATAVASSADAVGVGLASDGVGMLAGSGVSGGGTGRDGAGGAVAAGVVPGWLSGCMGTRVFTMDDTTTAVRNRAEPVRATLIGLFFRRSVWVELLAAPLRFSEQYPEPEQMLKEPVVIIRRRRNSSPREMRRTRKPGQEQNRRARAKCPGPPG